MKHNEPTYLVKVATDGTIRREAFTPDNSLKQLQAAVGGWIERVDYEKNDLDLYVNEEGKLEGLPYNRVLTVHSRHFHDPLVGNGVYVAHDDEGNTLGLTEQECAQLEKELIESGGAVTAA